MSEWRELLRRGLMPSLPAAGLEALRAELLAAEAGRPHRLRRGATTSPPPQECYRGWPVERADPVAFCGWQGWGLTEVGEVLDWLERVKAEADARAGQPGVVAAVVDAWDRFEATEALLLEEVEIELRDRRRAFGRRPLAVVEEAA